MGRCSSYASSPLTWILTSLIIYAARLQQLQKLLDFSNVWKRWESWMSASRQVFSFEEAHLLHLEIAFNGALLLLIQMMSVSCLQAVPCSVHAWTIWEWSIFGMIYKWQLCSLSCSEEKIQTLNQLHLASQTWVLYFGDAVSLICPMGQINVMTGLADPVMTDQAWLSGLRSFQVGRHV